MALLTQNRALPRPNALERRPVIFPIAGASKHGGALVTSWPTLGLGFVLGAGLGG